MRPGLLSRWGLLFLLRSNWPKINNKQYTELPNQPHTSQKKNGVEAANKNP